MASKKKATAAGGTGANTRDKAYVVLARKYRPQTFEDLIGQTAMVTTLRNAFASGRIAQAYMLTGVRGVGKTTTARILARAFNYETDKVSAPTIDIPKDKPGRHCLEIMEGRHADVIEMDAASNTGVDNVREIIENARYRPILARTKVFIIDEVHMLSKSAFNALLKTLEEPPEHVKFIFATTEIRKVPVTILSRCQRFDLRRVDVPELAKHLKAITAAENAKADDDALAMIARAAEGSVRDGLSILDQAIATGSGHVTAETVRAMLGLADRGRIFDLLEHLFHGDAAAALQALDALHRDGADPRQLLNDLADAVHITSRVKVVGSDAGGEGLSAEEKRRAETLAEELSIPLLSRAWQMLIKGIEDAARAPDPLSAAEMVLIRLAYTADLPSPDDLIKALGGETLSTRGERAGTSAPPPRDERAPLNEHVPAAPQAVQPSEEPARDTGSASEPELELFDANDADAEMSDAGTETAPPGPPAIGLADPRTFGEVVALAGTRRDARLKVHLEEHVSLVKFDAAAGSIDLFLLPRAPAEIANELREKLNRWTGRRWMVVLSKTRGERSIGEVRREREEAERAEIKKHPAVAAILEEFPDAEIADIRPIPGTRKDDTGTG